MRTDTLDWLTGFRDFAAAQPIHHRPTVGTGSPEERSAERMILAAQLATWLTGIDDVLAARRAWLNEGFPDGDPSPAIVITTSAVGIAVAEEMTESGSLPARSIAPEMVAVTERDYRLWCIANPDDHYGRHITIWNWIKTTVPPQRHAEFARHPLRDGESYWLHRAGIAGAGGADRRDSHLWKWTGRQAVLLEAFVVERSVGRVDDTMPG
jgi:hypothetical protein